MTLSRLISTLTLNDLIKNTFESEEIFEIQFRKKENKILSGRNSPLQYILKLPLKRNDVILGPLCSDWSDVRPILIGSSAISDYNPTKSESCFNLRAKSDLFQLPMRPIVLLFKNRTKSKFLKIFLVEILSSSNPNTIAMWFAENTEPESLILPTIPGNLIFPVNDKNESCQPNKFYQTGSQIRLKQKFDYESCNRFDLDIANITTRNIISRHSLKGWTMYY